MRRERHEIQKKLALKKLGLEEFRRESSKMGWEEEYEESNRIRNKRIRNEVPVEAKSTEPTPPKWNNSQSDTVVNNKSGLGCFWWAYQWTSLN